MTPGCGEGGQVGTTYSRRDPPPDQARTMTFVGLGLDDSGAGWAEYSQSKLYHRLKVDAWLRRHCHKAVKVMGGGKVGEVQLDPALPGTVCDCSKVLLRETRAKWAEYS